MRPLTILALTILLFSCGDTEGRNECVSRESKVLECRAVESARYYYNSPEMLEAQKEKCETAFNLDKWCY